ncbi:hypothetical protein [Persephonella atlantica]
MSAVLEKKKTKKIPDELVYEILGNKKYTTETIRKSFLVNYL